MMLNQTRPALSPITLAKTNGSGLRKCTSWIDSFLEYTEHLEAAPIWRQWAAISTIASVLQRKVWVRTSKGDLNPNLYTVLVGFAGTGKSVTISAAEVFLRELEEMTKPQGVHIAPTSIFADRDAIAGRDVGYNNLLSDLHSIYALYGRMRIDDDAIEAFRAWRDAGEKPSPTHPKLTHYCSRRTSHIIKLCMVASAARGSDMRITTGDFDIAKNWLLGAELSMPDIFKAGVTSNDSKTMEETWHYVWANFSKNKKPILENKIIQFVSMRMPAHSVLRTIEIMERDGTLKSKFDVKAGCKTYEPGPRRVDL
jgi:hypothetical protein